MGGSWRTISVALQANAAGYVGGLRVAQGATRQFGNETAAQAKKVGDSGSRMGSTWAKAGKVMGAGLLVLLVGLGAVIGESARFDTAMRNVQSLTLQTDDQIASIGDSLVEMSSRLPQSATVLAEGFYDIVSSGFAGADAMKVLEASAVAASAGMTTTDVSARAITATLNAYGMSADSAGDVSDILFATVDKGVISFEELAGSLGDFVGTAAAAGVPIDDAAAALAAMTLSGISADEASTSLNRVLQSFIKPSEEMSRTLGVLGLSLDDLGENGIGLEGVMAKLRTATGGQVEALMALFPEIRSARGALALMSAEGENYRATSAAITDEDERRGRAQEALNEQAKGFAFQLDIVKNKVTGLAIAGGTLLLPMLKDLMAAGVDFAGKAGGFLSDVWDRAQPAVEAYMGYMDAVIDLLGELWTAGKPLVGFLAAVFGGAALGALTAFYTGMEAATRFLTDHKEIVLGVATAYGVFKAAQVAGAIANSAFVSSIVTGFMRAQSGQLKFFATASTLSTAGQFRAVRDSVLSLVGASSTLGMSASGLAGATGAILTTTGGAAAGLASIAVGAGLAWKTLGDEQKKAADRASEFVESLKIDPTDIRSTLGGLQDIQEQMESLQGQADGGLGEQIWQNINPFVDNDIEAARREIAALAAEADAYEESAQNLIRNQQEIAAATGATVPAIDAMATSLGVDLSEGFWDSEEARKKVTEGLAKLGVQADLTGTDLEEALLDPDFAAKFEEMETLLGDVRNAWQDFTDVTKLTDDPLDPKRLEDAAKTVAEAEERLRDAKAGDPRAVRDAQEALDAAKKEAASKHDSADDAERAARAVRDAQEALDGLGTGTTANIDEAATNLAEARTAYQEVLDSDDPLDGSKIASFYEEQTAAARTFSTNIQTAISDGYDPQLISRLIQAGPEEAGPLLEALVKSSTDSFVEMVNNAEAELARLTEMAVAQARLTEMAKNSDTDELVNSLSEAMEISQALFTLGDKATAGAIADLTGLSQNTVNKVSDLFGLAIVDPVQIAAAQAKVDLLVDSMANAAAQDVTLHAELDDAQPQERIAILAAWQEDWAKGSNAEVTIDSLTADQRAAALLIALDAIDQKDATPTVTLGGSDDVEARLLRIKAALDGLTSGTILVGTDISLAAAQSYLPPGRATGGPVSRGRAYIVGERRPELFVPDQSGRIMPRVEYAPPRMPLITHQQGRTAGPSVHQSFHTPGFNEKTLAGYAARRTEDAVMGWSR